MPTRPAPLVTLDEANRRRRRKQRLRRLLLGFAFGLPLFLLACALFLKFGPKPPPPPVPPVVTPQQAQQTENHIDALREALANPTGPDTPPAADDSAPVRRSSGPGGAQIVTLRLSETDLNTFFAINPGVKRMLASRGVSAVQVILDQPANITVRASVDYQGHPANVQVEGVLSPDPITALHFAATGAQVGRLPAPPNLVTSEANKLAAKFTDQVHGRLPLTVQKVEVHDKTLILMGIATKRTALSAQR